MSARRLGVFGGTFDPPHLGHLIVAHDVADELSLDRVLLVLSARPPHRPEVDLTPAGVRYEMLRAAVQGDPLLEASALEMERPGPSYTADTLADLHQRHPGTDLVFLMGADQWSQIRTWRDPARIGEHATVAVMARPGEGHGEEPEDPGLGIAWRPCPVTRIDVSATEIRARVRSGRSIRHMVPNAVLEMIERNRLYAPTEASPHATHAARHAS